MSCILTILGRNLNVDAFVAKSKLRPYKKSYRGQPRLKSKPEGDKLPYSLISIETSNAGFSDFNKQVKDTLRYLKRNKEKLAHITQTKEVQYATLDFGIDLRIDGEKVLYQSDRFPKELLKLAGELGLDIELSIYPVDMEEMLEKSAQH